MPKKCRMRPERFHYYFTVEGDTEQWYLEWLQKAINDEAAKRKLGKQVIIRSKVEKDPVSYVKNATIVEDMRITQFIDCESSAREHQKCFQNVLSGMKEAEETYPDVTYQLGYSNYTFDLWIILHKTDCNHKYGDRSQYLDPINDAYQADFISMSVYKAKKNFQDKILKTLTLDDVRSAIQRAEKLEQRNKKDNTQKEHKGYSYYIDNPATSVHESIKAILEEIGL